MIGKPWQILIVEDDEDDFILLAQMISRVWRECVEVHWHPTPAGVIEKICSNQYEATLINSHLGSETGLHLIERIITACPTERVIFITDWPDPEIQREAIRKGARSSLHKNKLTGERVTEEIKRVVLESGL